MKYLIAISFAILIGCSLGPKNTASKNIISRGVAQSASLDITNYSSLIESEHFKVYQVKQDTPLAKEEVAAIVQNLESGFRKIFEYLGPDKSPKLKLIVLLNGESFLPGQPPRYPSVDSEATIRLYRFMGPGAVYLQGITHELVHAFRNPQVVLHEVQIGDFLTGYGFVEEAFAEYVATTVDPNNISFPRYGFPLDVVTGYWLSTSQEIPLTVLFNHHEINPKCITQAYPLRASFFKFLNATYGKDKLMALPYYEKPYSKDLFNQVYSKSLSDLVVDWRKWAQNQFDQFPGKDKIIESYKLNTPLKYLPICKAGQDWAL